MKRYFFFILILLMLILPGVLAEETITLFNKITVKTDIETLDLKNLNINNIQELRTYLDQLPHLKEVVMKKTKLSVAQLEGLIADYPSLRFDCAFVFARKTALTSQTAFSTMNTLDDLRYTDRHFAGAKYFKSLRALDLGHNAIRDLSFLNDVPELRVLILADNHITDLTPIASLINLEYLELFFNQFTDLSPLASLTKLRDLNLCRNRISDVTPLLGLKSLERLWLPDRFLTEEQKAELEAALPNCHILYEWSRSTSFGWRQHPRYTIIRQIFKSSTYKPFEP